MRSACLEGFLGENIHIRAAVRNHLPFLDAQTVDDVDAPLPLGEVVDQDVGLAARRSVE
jgi:hypothetical protein